MKRALLALGLVMASVSVPLTFAKTNNHATRRWTPRPVRPRLTFRHNVKKHGGQHEEPQEHPDTRRCSQNPSDLRSDSHGTIPAL